MNNFLPLDRKIMDHWLWEDKPFCRGLAWIDLLMLANYADKKKPEKGKIVTYKRGSVNLSMKQIAVRWGWDRRRVKRFLDLLENDNMITVNSTCGGTTITIKNYELYNGCKTTDGTTNSTTDGTTDSTTDGTTDSTTDGQLLVQQVRTTNKDKESKKERKEEGKKSNRARFTPPTQQEVEAYCAEKGYHISAERFIDFYTSKGWMVGKNPMKDWKAAVRNWSRSQRQEMTTKGYNRISEVDDW